MATPGHSAAVVGQAMAVTAGDQEGAVPSIGQVTRRRVVGSGNGPGSRRLGLGGFLLGAGSLLTAWSAFLLAIAVPAFDFTWFGIRVASHPGPFVVDDVSLAPPLALAIVLPVAILGVIGGARLWLGGSPRLALVASALWAALGAGIAIAGGSPDLLLSQAVLFALILSGSWARRAPGTRLNDLLRAGAVRPVEADF